MKIKDGNKYGKLSDDELRDFEIANDIILPEDYKHFLLEYNGGVPELSNNKQPNTVVSYIFGMHNGDYFASLYKRIDVLKDRIPFGTFPIASDSFGNLFLMTIHAESYGQIYFWDHEGEPKVQDGHCTENCSFVAYTFSEFLENLI